MSNLNNTTNKNVPFSVVNRSPFNSSYIGCYKDKDSEKAIPNRGITTTINNCNELAKKAGSPYFGMQNWEKGDFASCYYGDSKLTDVQVKKHGNSSECLQSIDYNYYGKTLANAVYKTKLDDLIFVDKKIEIPQKQIVGSNDNAIVKKSPDLNELIFDCVKTPNTIQCTLHL